MTHDRKIGIALVLLGAGLWGGSSNCFEYLMTHQHFTWQSALFYRMILMSVVFLGTCRLKKIDIFTILKDDWVLLLKFVVFGMLGMQITFLKAIYYSNAATATVLQYLMPAILLFMVLWQQKRPPQLREILAVGLAIIGTFLIATHGKGTTLAVSHQALFWGIASAFGMALYTIYAAKILTKYSCFAMLGWSSLATAIFLAIFTDISLQGGIFDFNTVWSFGVAFVLGTMVAYYAYLESTVYIPASETGALATFEPLSAYFFSIVFMGNNVGVPELIGASCILSMMVILARR